MITITIVHMIINTTLIIKYIEIYWIFALQENLQTIIIAGFCWQKEFFRRSFYSYTRLPSISV